MTAIKFYHNDYTINTANPGYIEGDTVYAAVSKDSLDMNDYSHLTPIAVHDNNNLYHVGDYLNACPAPSKFWFDIMRFETDDTTKLFGFASTLTGKIIAQPQFLNAETFYDNMDFARVCHSDCKSGLMDKSGHLMQPPGYDDVWDYHDGVYLVRTRSSHLSTIGALDWAAVDTRGQLLCSFDYAWCVYFGRDGWDGYIERGLNSKSYMRDKSGEIIFRLDEMPTKRWIKGESYWLIKKNGRYGIIRRDGTPIFEPTLSKKAAVKFFEKDVCR